MQQEPPPKKEPLPTPSGKQVSPPVQSTSLSSSLPYQQLQQQLLQQHNNSSTGIREPYYYGIVTPKRNTISYQKSCMIRPIPTSIFLGSIYTVYATIMQQMQSKSKSRQRHRTSATTSSGPSSSSILRTFGTSCGIVYVYYMIQCPMEAIQNKESYVHNGIAAFTLSYIGLVQQRIGVPFIPSYSIYELPHLARNLLGASIYSFMAMTLAAIYGNKSY